MFLLMLLALMSTISHASCDLGSECPAGSSTPPARHMCTCRDSSYIYCTLSSQPEFQMDPCYEPAEPEGYTLVGPGWCLDDGGLGDATRRRQLGSASGPQYPKRLTKEASEGTECKDLCDAEDECIGYARNPNLSEVSICSVYGTISPQFFSWSSSPGSMVIAASTGTAGTLCYKKDVPEPAPPVVIPVVGNLGENGCGEYLTEAECKAFANSDLNANQWKGQYEGNNQEDPMGCFKTYGQVSATEFKDKIYFNNHATGGDGTGGTTGLTWSIIKPLCKTAPPALTVVPVIGKIGESCGEYLTEAECKAYGTSNVIAMQWMGLKTLEHDLKGCFTWEITYQPFGIPYSEIFFNNHATGGDGSMGEYRPQKPACKTALTTAPVTMAPVTMAPISCDAQIVLLEAELKKLQDELNPADHTLHFANKGCPNHKTIKTKYHKTSKTVAECGVECSKYSWCVEFYHDNTRCTLAGTGCGTKYHQSLTRYVMDGRVHGRIAGISATSAPSATPIFELQGEKKGCPNWQALRTAGNLKWNSDETLESCAVACMAESWCVEFYYRTNKMHNNCMLVAKECGDGSNTHWSRYTITGRDHGRVAPGPAAGSCTLVAVVKSDCPTITYNTYGDYNEDNGDKPADKDYDGDLDNCANADLLNDGEMCECDPRVFSTAHEEYVKSEDILDAGCDSSIDNCKGNPNDNGVTYDYDVYKKVCSVPGGPAALVTEALVTEAPVTEAPVTEAPVTEAPVTEAPVTEAPVIAPYTRIGDGECRNSVSMEMGGDHKYIRAISKTGVNVLACEAKCSSTTSCTGYAVRNTNLSCYNYGTYTNTPSADWNIVPADPIAAILGSTGVAGESCFKKDDFEFTKVADYACCTEGCPAGTMYTASSNSEDDFDFLTCQTQCADRSDCLSFSHGALNDNLYQCYLLTNHGNVYTDENVVEVLSKDDHGKSQTFIDFNYKCYHKISTAALVTEALVTEAPCIPYGPSTNGVCEVGINTKEECMAAAAIVVGLWLADGMPPGFAMTTINADQMTDGNPCYADPAGFKANGNPPATQFTLVCKIRFDC